MIYMPAFSVDESGQGRTKNDLRGYDGGRYVQQSAPRPNVTHPSAGAKSIASNPGGPPSGPRYMSVISNKSPFQRPHVARHDSKRLPPNGDPFRDPPTIPPLPPAYATAASNEHALTRGPRTPSRGRKSGRGHRRGPFAAITNIPHLNDPETPIDRPVLMPGPTYPSVYAERSDHPPVQTIDSIKFGDFSHSSLEDTPSPVVLDQPALPLVLSPSPLPAESRRPSILDPSTPAPAEPSEPAVVDSPCSTVLATPVSQRRRSLSLRRRPAYEDLHSPSPPRSSLKKCSISRLWFYPPETKQVQASTVGPLRITKRSGSSSPTTPGSTSPQFKFDEDDTHDVILKVRAVFELLRGNEDEDEGTTARELLNRESVESSTHSRQRPEEEEEESDDDDEEYGNEVTTRSICSPPPPYALSPGLFPPDLYDSLKRDSPLDAFKYIKEDQPPVTPLQSPALTGVSDLRRQNSSSFTNYDRNSPRSLRAPRRSKSANTLTPAVSTELAYFNNNNSGSGSPKILQVPPRSKSTETLTPTISTELAYFNQSGLLAPTLSSLTLATAVSTELSYLKDDEQSALAPPVVIVESVDSAIDDILASFEHLMTSMGIKVQSTPQAPAAESTPRLDVPGSVSSTSLRSIKRVRVKPRPETGCYVYGGLAEECDAQWYDLLELDSYNSD